MFDKLHFQILESNMEGSREYSDLRSSLEKADTGRGTGASCPAAVRYLSQEIHNNGTSK